MGYCSIEEVRRLAGAMSTFVEGIKLTGAANDVNKTFYVPHRFIVDYDGDEDTDYVNDIVVYDDGAPVVVTSVDTLRNKIILTAAPTADSVMTIDYAYSVVRDSNILAIIKRVDEIIERQTRTKGVATDKTQYWDTDGTTRVFHFNYWPVTSITSITIGGTLQTYTISEDYWMYPNPTLAWWIKFNSAPATNNQGLKIIFSYGEANEILNNLSLYMSAREVVIENLATLTKNSGVYQGTQKQKVTRATDKPISLIRSFDLKIEQLWKQLGGLNRVNTI